jgi:hypothetical protein
MSNREQEERRQELWQLIRDVSACEEVPMSSIRELANAHVIEVTRYCAAWDKLCDEAYKVIEIAEERMEAADDL